jgi:hypothetical protein|tara:strand:- start:734 stop:1222 length:489 start_codon:yes stop_codon:yes gene_type:complete
MTINSKPLPPYQVLNENFRYNKYTGELKNWNLGHVVTTEDSSGYLVVRFQGKDLRVHRVCFYLETKKDPLELQVDHIDRDRKNNKFNNLRLLNNAQQQLNTKERTDNKSGRKGVFLDKKGMKWRSYITVEKKRIWLYRGDSWDQAVKERIKAEKKYYPEIFE